MPTSKTTMLTRQLRTMVLFIFCYLAATAGLERVADLQARGLELCS